MAWETRAEPGTGSAWALGLVSEPSLGAVLVWEWGSAQAMPKALDWLQAGKRAPVKVVARAARSAMDWVPLDSPRLASVKAREPALGSVWRLELGRD